MGNMAKVLKRPVDFMLTVPAVWSDKARQMTLEAAVRAGMGVASEAGSGSGLLKLITEPEGAAEYALRSMQPGMLRVSNQILKITNISGTGSIPTSE